MHVDYCLNISELPLECIEDCARPGPADDAVAYWLEELAFTVNRNRAIQCLAAYGAWEREELAASTDDELAARVLWLACGDFSEFITHCERDGIDPFAELPDDYSTPCGSDIFVLEG